MGSEIWLGADAKEPFAHVLAQACQDGVQWQRFEGASYHVHGGSEENFVVKNNWKEFKQDLLVRFPEEEKALDKFHALVRETRASAVDWTLARLPRYVY